MASTAMIVFADSDGLADVKFAEFLDDGPAEVDVHLKGRAGAAASHAAFVGEMLLAVHGRILQDNSPGRQLIGNGAEDTVVAFVAAAETPIPDADGPPVGNVADDAPRHEQVGLGDAADHDGSADAVSAELSHPAAGPGDGAVEEYVDVLAEAGLNASGQAHADDGEAGGLGAVGNEKGSLPSPAIKPSTFVASITYRSDASRLSSLFSRLRSFLRISGRYSMSA